MLLWVVARIDPYLGRSEDELKLGGELAFLGGRSRSSISCFATFVLCNIRSTFPCIILFSSVWTKINPTSNTRTILSLGSQWSCPFPCRVNVRTRDTERQFPWILLKPHKTEYSCVYSTRMEENLQIQSCDWPNKCPAGKDKTVPEQWEISAVFWNFLHVEFLSCWLFHCVEAAPSVKDKLHTSLIWGVLAACVWKQLVLQCWVQLTGSSRGFWTLLSVLLPFL